MITHGFFGKLPTMGDFVSRGWLTSSREGLDRLLVEAIAELLASSAAGSQAVAEAPCVVLSIRPGVIGDQGVVAVVLPSQDRVGRTFPLCAGVQWTEDGQGGMGWPSLAYSRALIVRVLECVDAQAEPDALLSEIVALGSPRQFRQTFVGLGGDETLPRLSAETKLLRVQGPLAVMSPAHAALCSMLNEASDVLGIRLDEHGEAQDFFVCRRVESGAALASMFDGRWVERGWTSYDAPTPSTAQRPAALENIDDDATQPRHRAIDTAAAAPDSLDSL